MKIKKLKEIRKMNKILMYESDFMLILCDIIFVVFLLMRYLVVTFIRNMLIMHLAVYTFCKFSVTLNILE